MRWTPIVALVLLVAIDAPAEDGAPDIDMDRLVGAAIETRAALRTIDQERAQATAELRTQRAAA